MAEVAYIKYYTKQAGGALPHFKGARYQRGGNFMGRIFKFAQQPFFEPILNIGKYLGKHLLRGAVSTGRDVLEGRKFKESAKTAAKSVSRKIALEALDKLAQAGSGVGSRKRAGSGISLICPPKKKRKATKSRQKGIKGVKNARSRTSPLSRTFLHEPKSTSLSRLHHLASIHL